MLFNSINFVNLTPHAVNIVSQEGNPIVSFPSEGIVRCKQQDVVTGDLAGIPITQSTFGEVQGLPAPIENTFYIVSRLVLTACPDRTDLVVPNGLVRNSEGQIIGCSSLAIK